MTGEKKFDRYRSSGDDKLFVTNKSHVFTEPANNEDKNKKNALLKSNNFARSDNFFMKPSGSGNADRTKKPLDKNETPVKETRERKPFDKKKWRLQKYSKKYKLQLWEDKRKRTVLKDYYKEIQDDQPKFDVQTIYDEHENVDVNTHHSEPETRAQTKRGTALKRAHLEFRRIKEEKQRKREEHLKRKAERDEALKLYKKNKTAKYKRLNKKTKKGQPVMKERMEMLLEQIQKSV